MNLIKKFKRDTIIDKKKNNRNCVWDCIMRSVFGVISYKKTFKNNHKSTKLRDLLNNYYTV